MKKYWSWFLGLLGIITALFFVERGKRKQAEAKNENSEFDTKDQLLIQKEEALKLAKQEEEAKIKELEKKNESDKAAQENLTPSEREDYWKNRK